MLIVPGLADILSMPVGPLADSFRERPQRLRKSLPPVGQACSLPM
jgi:hypothetical protein